MKKYIYTLVLLSVAAIINAVPAYRGWQTRTQADGTTIEVQQAGDEYYHYMINRVGQQVRLNKNGMYEVVGEAPSPAKVQALRAEGKAKRVRKGVGLTPNPAPRGVVILANFADTQMKAAHTQSVFDELCNATNCTVNAGYPSAAQYFADQSNGAYRPQFDVFGPVTLSHGYAFYGENDGEDEDGDGYGDGNDKYAADAAIEACILAKAAYPELNFANYDSDGDDLVDFVYVIYAGEGEASGGHPNTIWPHNWNLIYQVFPFDENGQYDPVNGTRFSCCFTEDDIVIDDKMLGNYAISAELMWDELGGIGTLCHEFGHVIGLPDFYDTNYGVNSKLRLTPNEWNIMDGGSYNGGGHCPPNYDPWEKYFFGWVTPENLGEEPQFLTLVANGQDGYNPYQINASGNQEESTTEGLNYYIENRQQQGWDEFVPSSGMVIWKVDFDSYAWQTNSPNNTANEPKYTLIIPDGTRIGAAGGDANVWPYGELDSCEFVIGKPLLSITRNGSLIDLLYIAELTAFTVRWMVDGVVVASGEYNLDGSDNIVAPANVTPCEGTEFIGWTKKSGWCDPIGEPDDLTLTPSGKVTKSATYHALFK